MDTAFFTPPAPYLVTNFMPLRDWLYVTRLLGWIDGGVLKVRKSVVYVLIGETARGKAFDLLVSLVSDDPPKDLGGCPIEVVGTDVYRVPGNMTTTGEPIFLEPGEDGSFEVVQ